MTRLAGTRPPVETITRFVLPAVGAALGVVRVVRAGRNPQRLVRKRRLFANILAVGAVTAGQFALGAGTRPLSRAEHDALPAEVIRAAGRMPLRTRELPPELADRLARDGSPGPEEAQPVLTRSGPAVVLRPGWAGADATDLAESIRASRALMHPVALVARGLWPVMLWTLRRRVIGTRTRLDPTRLAQLVAVEAAGFGATHLVRHCLRHRPASIRA